VPRIRGERPRRRVGLRGVARGTGAAEESDGEKKDAIEAVGHTNELVDAKYASVVSLTVPAQAKIFARHAWAKLPPVA
jgi:hypothetical protein